MTSGFVMLSQKLSCRYGACLASAAQRFQVLLYLICTACKRKGTDSDLTDVTVTLSVMHSVSVQLVMLVSGVWLVPGETSHCALLASWATSDTAVKLKKPSAVHCRDFLALLVADGR